MNLSHDFLVDVVMNDIALQLHAHYRPCKHSSYHKKQNGDDAG
jgi:hypothetical protein